MRPRSADSFRKIHRQAAKVAKERGEDGIADHGLLIANKIGGHLFPVAGTSCPRPSMERPAPCSAPLMLRCFPPLSSLETAHLNLETPHPACFKGTRKCGIGRDRNFFRKFSACTNICPTPNGNVWTSCQLKTLSPSVSISNFC